MVTVRFKYVVEDVDRHGNVRLYFRRKGQSKIRLSGIPGSDEFMAEYRAAIFKVDKERRRHNTRAQLAGHNLQTLEWRSSKDEHEVSHFLVGGTKKEK
jgi:hypothetical protein